MNTKTEKGRMLIDGELVASESGEWLESVNPANEEVIGYVPMANTADVHRAVAAAEKAQAAWGALDATERGKYVRKIGQALRERADELLQLEVIDTGNTVTKMKGDVGAAAHAMEFFAGLGTELKGESIPASADNLHITVREPYGVVGRIVPFNHPIKFAAHAIAAPLMAGNSVVLKPPEQSPLSAQVLGEICRDILPPGVVNIVTGPGMTGDALVRHPLVKRIAFTGSVPTGMAILRAAAETSVKNITLELGGKNPLIQPPAAA
jgi:acyl-CoA reductase-like NAD-dependent aldehyde dehydrogenase